jgi:hypothetical protein
MIYSRAQLEELAVAISAAINIRNRADHDNQKNPGSAMQSEYWAPNISEYDLMVLKLVKEMARV